MDRQKIEGDFKGWLRRVVSGEPNLFSGGFPLLAACLDGAVGYIPSMRNIREILNTTMTFPLELTVTTGQTFEIEHPDFTYLNPNTGDLWHFPREGAIAVIDPAHIVKVLPKGRPNPF